MFIIFLDAITIALETSSSLNDSNPKVFKIIDILFFAIYSLEFLLKVYAEPMKYWKNPYNLFDLSLLILLMVQVILEEVRPDQEEQSLDALKVVKGKELLFIYIYLISLWCLQYFIFYFLFISSACSSCSSFYFVYSRSSSSRSCAFNYISYSCCGFDFAAFAHHVSLFRHGILFLWIR